MDKNEIVYKLSEKINNCIQIKHLENYADINLITTNKNIPMKFNIKQNIDKELFINDIKNISLDWSKNGMSDVILGNILYKDFLKENTDKYIFHNFLDQLEIIKKHIPFPKLFTNVKLRISRFYSGYKHSGSFIHRHSIALNYLISGKKIWILFPSTPKNCEFFNKHAQNDGIQIDYFLTNYNLFNENLEHISIILQEENEVLLIPNFCFHGVINVCNSYGITYSWQKK